MILSKRFLISFLLFFSLHNAIEAQFARHNIIGASVSILPDDRDRINIFPFVNISGVFNYMTSLNRSVYIGFEYININTIGSRIRQSNERKTFYSLGIISHINMYNGNRWRIFLESDFNYSDFCQCDRQLDPTRRPGSYYAGWGTGVNIRLLSWMSADFAFKSSYLLNRAGIDITKGPAANRYATAGFNIDILWQKHDPKGNFIWAR